ncbi:MAG: helix-turn-helix transcriptional regulator [Bacteroidota bacterium]
MFIIFTSPSRPIMPTRSHIPLLSTISEFYEQLRIGQPQGDDFAVMRIEEQPETKRLEMPLFRCNFYRVVFFSNPGVHFSLPDQQMAAGANSVYFSYPGKVESWQTTDRIRGYLVCFTADFAQMDRLHSAFTTQYPFFQFSARSLICSSEQELPVLRDSFERLIREVQEEHHDQDELVRLLLHELLLRIRRLYNLQQEQLTSGEQNQATIYNQFRQEVDQYFIELADGKQEQQLSVRHIAEQLLLHPSYLNSVIKQLTGQTASSFIQAKTLLEAKSYLLHTDLQVAEVAFRLGFSQTPYFNRFFKQQTGLTPTNFRKNI